jgi:hypothetical protein
MDAAHAESVSCFVEDLNRLRLEAGNPSLRQLADLSGSQFSKNTLDDHLSHRRTRLPPWQLVGAYVTACHRAATSTGLDAAGLGTLKDWHERYLAALRGDTVVSGPFRSAVNSKNEVTPGPPILRVYEDHTTKTKHQESEPARILTRSTPRGSVDSGIDSSDATGSDAPISDNINDEIEIAANGAGRWSLHWRQKPSDDAAVEIASLEQESTESLSSSTEVFPEDRTDLTVSLEVDTALFFVKRGPCVGRQFIVHQDRTTVGRDPDSDIFLDDATVSRMHSVIYRRAGRFTVRDAGSLNGTYVNRAVTDKFLKSGDEVQIGVYRFVFLQSY